MLGHEIDVDFTAQETGKQFYKAGLTFYPQTSNIEGSRWPAYSLRFSTVSLLQVSLLDVKCYLVI